MKEFPVLCLAILAIVFIHATQKSGQKIPENKKKQNNQRQGNPVEREANLVLPRVYFTNNSGSGEFSLQAKTVSKSTLTGTDKKIDSRKPEVSNTLNQGGNVYNNPAYLFFHERFNNSHTKTMAIR